MKVWFSGISMNPSALDRVVMAPEAPVSTGSAMSPFSSWRSLTATNVRRPLAENILLPAKALAVAVSFGDFPAMVWMTGFASRW